MTKGRCPDCGRSVAYVQMTETGYYCTNCGNAWSREINPQSLWIKVTDRLPDLYQWVLVCNSPKGTKEPQCVNILRWDGEKWDSVDEYYEPNSPTFMDVIHYLEKEEISHWQPLPKPPED